MSKEVKDELFLNLLSHLYSADVATASSRSLRHRYPRVAEALAEAQALANEARRSFIFLFFVRHILNHRDKKGTKFTKNFFSP